MFKNGAPQLGALCVMAKASQTLIIDVQIKQLFIDSFSVCTVCAALRELRFE